MRLPLLFGTRARYPGEPTWPGDDFARLSAFIFAVGGLSSLALSMCPGHRSATALQLTVRPFNLAHMLYTMPFLPSGRAVTPVHSGCPSHDALAVFSC